MTGCLSQRDMVALLEGSGSPEQLTFWRRHLRLCDSCAAAVARLRVGLESEPQDPSQAEESAGSACPSCSLVGLEPNLQLGDFRLNRRLGAGGMGVVYQALQISLDRQVALKVLPCSLGSDTSAIERFHREARAAATLRHPNIVTIYAEGLEQGVCYIAMEMVQGEPLDRVIESLRTAGHDRGHREDAADATTPPASLLHACRSEREYFDTAARLISEVAEALAYAHDEGIVHRDVKPSNLMLARNGRLVLLDFGVARICKERAMTLTGSFVGTPRYMSPEQIADGHDGLDHRSDIYSLGVTLYELLTLRPLFDGQTRERVISQILAREPARPRQIKRHIPVDLETICLKAIEKKPGQRYARASDMAEDLRRYLSGRVIKAKPPGAADRLCKLLRRRKLATVLSAGLVLALALAGNIAWNNYFTRWAQQDAIAQIDRLIQEDAYFAALTLAERAERYVPDHPVLADRWQRLSREFMIATDPPDARVFLSEYRDRKPRWKYLGRSPIRNARIPFGTYRWRVQKPGFATIEVVRTNDLPSSPLDGTGPPPKQIDFTLRRLGEFSAEMVWIPPSDLDQQGLYHGRRKIPSAPAFQIDKYEVTNGDFQEFVFSGGYTDRSYWQHEFVKDGKIVPWSEAIEVFRDQTGRPGPATWANGRYPRGKRKCPVGGISWYEAAAYARFRKKSLPTIFHWTLAARADDDPYRITCRSNFGDGPAPVGRHTGMGHFGLYDAAGNAREWCANALEGAEDQRCILGGTWGELDTAFINGAMRSVWDRDPSNGLRCVKYLGGKDAVPQLAFAPVECRCRDFANFEPVSDEVFDSYIDTWYRYDATELNARVEMIDDDLGFCWRERVTFDAAYPNDRVIAYLYLPKNIKQPYQAIVWFPSGGARFGPWDQRDYRPELVHIIRSGRAVIVPYYRGTYERRLKKPFYPPEGVQSRNLYVQRSQDLRRTIDYLATREDIDTSRLAYVGLSWGAQMGPVMIAPESRFKTGVLLLGGICGCRRHPASDPANFAPRVTIPILQINGKEDSLYPYETAQKPLFDLLGTPDDQKKHVILPGEHHVRAECREQYHQELDNWLDQYLGLIGQTDDNKNEGAAPLAANRPKPAG